jgi:hypothetical protein
MRDAFRFIRKSCARMGLKCKIVIIRNSIVLMSQIEFHDLFRGTEASHCIPNAGKITPENK